MNYHCLLFLIGRIIWNARHPFPKRTRPTYHCLSSLKASSHHDRPDPPIRPRSGDMISNAQQGAKKKKKKKLQSACPCSVEDSFSNNKTSVVAFGAASKHRRHRLRRILFTRRWSDCTLLARSCYRSFIFGLGMRATGTTTAYLRHTSTFG
ncbi:uncharacterized protein VDAG_01742 [Verticillium dahliae VdLs.17]|uniref:Uncharacterized protein n=1 Tax=Verticillium dahliae (strain VdLs.17 / ATCC MYA-4575 / FGSC 10137) TaxID=498257 RepID=G2WVV6_VERDV|nr:uncharacterized protein VDAG_01742 [Verticillium dahliae VdLs.17]EGY19726.1 hypothetical protein VDAG_01742 [Verticillium dahliae VdLs.17]